MPNVNNSCKYYQALNLRKLVNMNPRSIYGKIKQFISFVKQQEIYIVFLSESWERENKRLADIITLKDYQVISNV